MDGIDSIRRPFFWLAHLVGNFCCKLPTIGGKHWQAVMKECVFVSNRSESEVHPTARSHISAARRTLMWELADDTLQTRALGRIALVTLWFGLAILYGAEEAWLWGIGAMLGSGLALLHSRRRLVESTKDRLPAALVKAVGLLMPYVDKPHVNFVGVVEALGILGIALGTGWPGRVFVTNPTAALLGNGLVLLFVFTMVNNMTGHPAAWSLEKGARFFHAIRWSLPFLFFTAAAGLLIYASPEPEVEQATIVSAVLLAFASVVEGRRVDALVARIDHMMDVVALRVQAIDSETVHSGLQNPARLVDLSAVPLISDGPSRAQVRELVVRVSDVVSRLELGKAEGLRNASEVLSAIQRLRSANDPFPVAVERDLVASHLGAGDVALISMLAPDLIINAIKAPCHRASVSLDADEDQEGSTISLTVRCWCDGGFTEASVRPGSSLYERRQSLEALQGTLTIFQHSDGSHSTRATWPSRCRPASLGNNGSSLTTAGMEV